MIALTDRQIDAIQGACRPLDADAADALRNNLFMTLMDRRDDNAIGDGELARMLRALQHRFLRPSTSAALRRAESLFR
jgi:hypothetical protein